MLLWHWEAGMGIVQIKMLQSLPRLSHFFLMGLMGGLWVLKYKEGEQIAFCIVASLWLIYRVFIKFILTIFASILIFFLMRILYILTLPSQKCFSVCLFLWTTDFIFMGWNSKSKIAVLRDINTFNCVNYCSLLSTMYLKFHILLKPFETNISLFLFQPEEFRALIEFFEIQSFHWFIEFFGLTPYGFPLPIHLLGCLFFFN